MTDFYELTYDAERYPDRWHLDDPIDEEGNVLDANLLPQTGPYSGTRITKVQVDTRYPGRVLDFSFGYFNFLMVRSEVSDIIESHGGRIQRFPVTLEPNGESGYEVIFTLDSPKGLVDLERAKEYECYAQTDTDVDLRYGGVPPRQKGMFRKLYPFYISADKAHGLAIFRPWERDKLIVSAALKTAFENANVSGIKYRLAS